MVKITVESAGEEDVYEIPAGDDFEELVGNVLDNWKRSRHTDKVSFSLERIRRYEKANCR